MSIVPRSSPGPFFRWFFKIPLLLCKLGLGCFLGSNILVLTTIGRKSGKPRKTPLGYSYASTLDTYYEISGWEGRADWYRNLQTNSSVHVQVKAREFDSKAARVPTGEYIQMLAEYNQCNPFATRMWTRVTGVPFDDTESSLRLVAERFPMVALRPCAQDTENARH